MTEAGVRGTQPEDAPSDPAASRACGSPKAVPPSTPSGTTPVARTVPRPATTSLSEFEAMWQRQQVWWHLLFGALLLVVGVVTVIDIEPPRSVVALLLLLALAAAYALVGRRALVRPGAAWGAAYLTLAWALTMALVALTRNGSSWLLAFALFPQTWAMLSRRGAIVTTVLAVTGMSAVQLAVTPQGDLPVSQVLTSAAISIALSTVLGLFIDRIVREVRRRAEVIDELRRTRAQLAVAERAEGTFAERERVSREIHDTLAQGFTSVVALARASAAALDREDLDTVRERLALIEQTAAENLSEARLIVAELSPAHLQARTLTEALQRLVDAVSRESGVPGEMTVAGDPHSLGPAVEVMMLRAAQETLANMRRHSGASQYAVRLAFDEPDRVVLTVTDDGNGFDPDARDPGYGLDGVAARAADLGGAARIESAPGAGTTVVVEVPR